MIVGVSTFYFNSNEEKIGDVELCYGFSLAYLTHAGSVAMGAFLNPVVAIIKLTVYQIAKILEKLNRGGHANPIFKCFARCGSSCLTCFEDLVDCMNEGTFCYIAVTGDDFLDSAWSSFLLNLKHGTKFMVAKMIANGFILLGKISITVGNCFTVVLFMKYFNEYEVDSLSGPVILTGLSTWVAATMFL